MAEISNDITKTIGSTPLVRLNRIAEGLSGTIYAKIESRNPLGSVKDRIGLSMIATAEVQGMINPKTTIVEPTSGNTGLALAFICAARNYRLILTMPETMSIERRKLLAHLDARLVLTPGNKGMKGAIAEAEAILSRTENAYMPNQFANPANPEIHRKTTAEEIWADTDGKANLRDNIEVVGLTGRFDETLLLLKKAFGWGNVFYARQNVVRKRPHRDQLSADTLAVIHKYNQLDMELYQFATTLFEEQVRKQGASFAEEVRSFRRANRLLSWPIRVQWLMQGASIRTFLEKP